MFVEIVVLVAGIIILVALAEMVIRNSIDLARHFHLSDTFIGLTLLSIGTSLPEVMTHIVGSLDILSYPEKINLFSGLLIGNNIGSDIFQQNFILPLIGIIATITVIKKNLFVQIGALIGAALLVMIFSFGGIIGRLEGALLLITYLAYLLYLKKINIKEKFEYKKNGKHPLISILLICFSFLVMAFTVDRVLNVSTIILEQLSLSASFFGVFLLGIASAMPELTTSLSAFFKGKKDISAGILIGSNITNPLMGIGIGALISTYTVPSVVIFYDLPIKIITACLIYLFLIRKKDLSKIGALILMALFFAYLIVRWIYFPVDF